MGSERSLVKHSRKSFWLKYDWARALRLRTLLRIRREVRISNDLGRAAWNDLWSMKIHIPLKDLYDGKLDSLPVSYVTADDSRLFEPLP